VTAEVDDAVLRRRLPPANAVLDAPVGGRVDILRDHAGVPHVYAAATLDLYFGLGFAMAQDRLWQMDRLRRRALGTQAEILGPAYVRSDLLHRAVGIPRIAECEAQRIDEATRGILDSFVRGINHHIEQCGKDLPIEFELLDYAPEPFTVRDTLAIMRAESWSLNGRLYTLTIAEAARLLPESLRAAYLTPEAPDNRILPPGSPYPEVDAQATQPLQAGLLGMGDGSGSNNWAISAGHTASGQALLCSDPHQPFWVPSSWYEYAVHGPQDDAAGAAHPGVPGLWWGANGAIAWGITNNAASARDLYREQVHPTDARLYRDGQDWRQFEEYDVEIRVRGQAAVHHTQRSTVRGPIVNHTLQSIDDSGADDAPLALRWVGQEHFDDVRAAIAVGRARTWADFRTALRDWGVAVFNFGFADSTGQVGYQCAGRVPIRGRQVRGYREANEPADTWQGYVPFEGLPSVLNPERGYVASANERVAADDYPYPLHGSWASGYRAERIRQALAPDGAFDRAQAIALQNDVKNCRAERLCPPLVEWLALEAQPDVVLFRDTLSNWDYRYTTDSCAPALFETFMEVWQQRVMREHFPVHLQPLVRGQTGPAATLIEGGDLDWFQPVTVPPAAATLATPAAASPAAASPAAATRAPNTELRAELVAAAVSAMQLVRERFGAQPRDWQWGAVHRAHWLHPLSTPERTWLDIGPQPVDGGVDTLRSTGLGQPAFAAASGAEYRLVVDFAQPDQFLAVQNIGNSGQPGSPHYADQFPAWLAGTYHVVQLKRADVERDLEGTTVLEPSGP
jgi:penicillin G amidase